jgi:hypothetical protein
VVLDGFHQRFFVRGEFFRRVEPAMRQFFDAFETQVGATDHQQRDHQPGGQRADDQGRGHQDQLVEERALGDGPDDGNFPRGVQSRDLIGIEGQVVPSTPAVFFAATFVRMAMSSRMVAISSSSAKKLVAMMGGERSNPFVFCVPFRSGMSQCPGTAVGTAIVPGHWLIPDDLWSRGRWARVAGEGAGGSEMEWVERDEVGGGGGGEEE